jgi:hypothetical protein
VPRDGHVDVEFIGVHNHVLQSLACLNGSASARLQHCIVVFGKVAVFDGDYLAPILEIVSSGYVTREILLNIKTPLWN